MSGHELTVGTAVIAELVRLAAFEVPGVARVGRGGPAWRRVLGGRSVSVRLHDEQRRSSGSGSSPGPARRSGRSPTRSASRSPRPSSGCSGSTSEP